MGKVHWLVNLDQLVDWMHKYPIKLDCYVEKESNRERYILLSTPV